MVSKYGANFLKVLPEAFICVIGFVPRDFFSLTIFFPGYFTLLTQCGE